MQISTIGLDVAKNVVERHAIDSEGRHSASARSADEIVRGHRTMSCRHRSLFNGPSLGGRADGARPLDQADAAGLREGYVKRNRTMRQMRRRSARR